MQTERDSGRGNLSPLVAVPHFQLEPKLMRIELDGAIHVRDHERDVSALVHDILDPNEIRVRVGHRSRDEPRGARVEIIGNLGADPEQRYMQNGVTMTSIRVAVNSRRRGADGESVERTDWFRARAMGSKAEYVSRFTKGQRVLVVGRLEIGEWQTREGETRTSYDIWADDIVNLSPREDNGGARPGGGYSSAPAQTAGVGREDEPRSQTEPSASSASTERPVQSVGARTRRASTADTTDLEDLPF
jgi:single-strand DNA-binding protein